MQKRQISVVVLAVALVFCAQAASAALTMKTILGNPLKINVASDGSFQVFNVSVPGNGQIYPTTCDIADMGVFARIDGTLYSPGFSSHPCGTATGNLGAYVPWSSTGISEVTGSGSGVDPFVVTVGLQAGNDVRLNLTVTYVGGDNFFRIRTSVFQTATHRIDVTLGADIYLGGSDTGIFFTVPALNAVGGEDCLIPATYHILLIPLTEASTFGTGVYSTIWSQIAANQLQLLPPEGCVDNGAAIEWMDVTRSAATADILSAVSFGDIPSINAFSPFSIVVEPTTLLLYPGTSGTLTVTTRHNEQAGFNSELEFTAEELPEGFSLKFDQTKVPAPGDGTITATLTVDSRVAFGFYPNLGILATGGGQRLAGRFNVEVICDPPLILGTANLRSQTVARGSSVTLHVEPLHNGPFTYQWYSGHAPFTYSPIANSNSPDLKTGPITSTQEYWVRVSNACGSVDSETATIIPR